MNSLIFAVSYSGRIQADRQKRYNDAANLLADLWTGLSKDPPRVIIAMTKHGYQEGWVAHRWDLTTGHLTSHHCVHVESRVEPYDPRELWCGHNN